MVPALAGACAAVRVTCFFPSLPLSRSQALVAVAFSPFPAPSLNIRSVSFCCPVWRKGWFPPRVWVCIQLGTWPPTLAARRKRRLPYLFLYLLVCASLTRHRRVCFGTLRCTRAHFPRFISLHLITYCLHETRFTGHPQPQANTGSFPLFPLLCCNLSFSRPSKQDIPISQEVAAVSGTEARHAWGWQRPVLLQPLCSTHGPHLHGLMPRSRVWDSGWRDSPTRTPPWRRPAPSGSGCRQTGLTWFTNGTPDLFL